MIRYDENLLFFFFLLLALESELKVVSKETRLKGGYYARILASSTTSNVSKQFRFEWWRPRGRAVESGTKRVVIKADNANARETERRRKVSVSNSRSGSGGDTAPAEISSKYAKSRPGRPHGLSITTGWHSVQNLWICRRRRRQELKRDTTFFPLLPFCSPFCPRRLTRASSKRIQWNIVSFAPSPRDFLELFPDIFASKTLENCSTKDIFQLDVEVSDGQKCGTLQSVIRFSFFSYRFSIRISFTACVPLGSIVEKRREARWTTKKKSNRG